MATNTEEKKEEAKAPKTTDFLAQIGGNLNPKNAKEIFGGKWIEAMNVASKAGGHGVFIEEHHADLYDQHIFGGLAIPQGDRFEKRRAEINAALNGVK